jgi:Protein of unknown function (DUF2975)
MITAARWTLRVLNWLNWGFGIPIVLLGIIGGYLIPDQFLEVSRAGGSESPEAILMFMQVAFPMTAPVIWLAHLIFTRLIAMIDTIHTGQVFSTTNADRLRTVAWALLGTQIIDLIVGLYMQYLSQSSGEYLGWSFGMTGWIAVLLLFVLSGLFREGATMREELEGTV